MPGRRPPFGRRAEVSCLREWPLVVGPFSRGDAVEIRDPEGNRVAAGTTNYASDELAKIRGMKSDRIAETLGYSYGDEVIHRDNMVLF
ncbi:PUA domain-containing protein [Candidatus Amarobacter glycogenicus]|uniref:PUA domain-containing protein n=1 Tax=Candidatus Amarobacter glycogenicus TaxID=3140699 RepID=UPI0031CC3B7E